MRDLTLNLRSHYAAEEAALARALAERRTAAFAVAQRVAEWRLRLAWVAACSLGSAYVVQSQWQAGGLLGLLDRGSRGPAGYLQTWHPRGRFDIETGVLELSGVGADGGPLNTNGYRPREEGMHPLTPALVETFRIRACHPSQPYIWEMACVLPSATL